MTENRSGINPEFRAGSGRSLAITATDLYSGNWSDRRNAAAGPDTGKTLLGVRPRNCDGVPEPGGNPAKVISPEPEKGFQCGPQEENISDEADRK